MKDLDLNLANASRHLVRIETANSSGIGFFVGTNTQRDMCAFATASALITDADRDGGQIVLKNTDSMVALNSKDRIIYIDTIMKTAVLFMCANSINLPTKSLHFDLRYASASLVGNNASWFGYDYKAEYGPYNGKIKETRPYNVLGTREIRYCIAVSSESQTLVEGGPLITINPDNDSPSLIGCILAQTQEPKAKLLVAADLYYIDQIIRMTWP